MLAPAPQPQRVRCRQIAESDLDGLAGFLAHGFPRTDTAMWHAGFDRLKTLPPVEGMPRFGYVLESESGVVGALLMIASRRGARTIANLSSWYVDPNYRVHSTLLVGMATRQKDVIYLNASPAPHTWRTLQAQNFRPFNFGRSAAMPIFSLGGGRVSAVIPDNLPERDLLLAHRALGCLSLVWEKKGEVLPFVFKPRRLERPPVKMMDLIYCRATGDFVRAAGALGRYLFFRHGAFGVILDGKVQGMPSHYVAGKEPRYFKGPDAPNLNDLAFTEMVVFP